MINNHLSEGQMGRVNWFESRKEKGKFIKTLKLQLRSKSQHTHTTFNTRSRARDAYDLLALYVHYITYYFSIQILYSNCQSLQGT